MRFSNGEVGEIKKGENDAFICGCSKELWHSRSMLRYAKQCSGKQLDQDVRIELEDDMSYASNSMNENEDMEIEDLGDCVGI